ncbi:MAG: hypothetical protein ACREDD_12430 [Methylocella sp.]
MKLILCKFSAKKDIYGMKRIVIVPTFLPAMACAFCLGGCAAGSVPLALIGQHGEILRGTRTVSLGGVSISVTNGKTTCSGSYGASGSTFPILCSDGRTGIARFSDPESNGGKVRFSDGTEGDFIFGDGARQI